MDIRYARMSCPITAQSTTPADILPGQSLSPALRTIYIISQTLTGGQILDLQCFRLKRVFIQVFLSCRFSAFARSPVCSRRRKRYIPLKIYILSNVVDFSHTEHLRISIKHHLRALKLRYRRYLIPTSSGIFHVITLNKLGPLQHGDFSPRALQFSTCKQDFSNKSPPLGVSHGDLSCSLCE